MSKKVDYILKKLAERKPKKVLDVGAGDCEISFYFAKVGSDVDALEPSPKGNCADEKGVSLIRQKIENFDIQPDFYDLIILRSVIHFLKPETVFKEVLPKIERGLKKGGFLYILTMTPPEGSFRYTHKPDDITNSFTLLTLSRREEKKQKMEFKGIGFQHTTWKLVYKK